MCFHCDNGNTDLHIPTEYRTVLYHGGATSGKWICAQCNAFLTVSQAGGNSPHICEGKYILITSQRPEPAAEIVGGVPHGFGIWVDGKFRPVNLGALGKVITDLQEWKESALRSMSKVDLQRVGEVLDLKVGTDITTKVLVDAIIDLKIENSFTKQKLYDLKESIAEYLAREGNV